MADHPQLGYDAVADWEQGNRVVLGRSDQTTSRDAIFGEFEVVDYDDIPGRLAMTDFFLDFWRSKGGETRAASRADISPNELKKYLEHVVLLDVVREENSWKLIVRLIGGHVSGFYGEITGKDVRDMENNKAIERIYHACGKVIENGLPKMTVSPALSPDRKYLEAIALYLPLFDKNGEVNKIMVAVHVSTPSQS